MKLDILTIAPVRLRIQKAVNGMIGLRFILQKLEIQNADEDDRVKGAVGIALTNLGHIAVHHVEQAALEDVRFLCDLHLDMKNPAVPAPGPDVEMGELSIHYEIGRASCRERV